MQHRLIASARKRKAAVLEHELGEALDAVRSGQATPAVLAEVEQLSAELAKTRTGRDAYTCLLCSATVSADDPAAGGLHFRRMSRHDGSDKLVVEGSAGVTAEIKLCGDCYGKLYRKAMGHSATAEISRRATARAKASGKPAATKATTRRRG